MNLENIHKAHFIGVGGIGVSALLRFFASRGIRVSGTDDVALPPLESLPEGKYYSSANPYHVVEDIDVVIYSPAVPEGHVERVRAREMGISELSYPEALALVTGPFNTIAISGTHGKSTTTAITGKLFEAGGFDPSIIVGAEIPGWNRNLRMGESDIFIVEACEYRRHMLLLSPQTIVLTNLELDHPDYYKDIEDMKSAFIDYIKKLSHDGLLVINNDDALLRDIVRHCDSPVVRFGVEEGSDLFARNISQEGEIQKFELVWKGEKLGEFTTALPGIYNIYNILAAVAVYLSYGGYFEHIASVIENFSGAGRRFEIIGHIGKTTVISDYAHHPTALSCVVLAAQKRYPGKNILTIFRPHQRERTQKLFDYFVDVLGRIPHMILVEIYDVAGRENNIAISAKDLIREVKKHDQYCDIIYAADFAEAQTIARYKLNEYDVLLVAGAGDADQLAHSFVKNENL